MSWCSWVSPGIFVVLVKHLVVIAKPVRRLVVAISKMQDFGAAVAQYVTDVHVFYWKGHTRLSLANTPEVWSSYIRLLKTPTFLLAHMPDDDEILLPRKADTLKRTLEKVQKRPR